MIRQFQDSYFSSGYPSLVWGYNVPNFTKVALAYGIGSYSISLSEEIDTGLMKLWEDPSLPFLLEVSLDVHTNVYPKMLFGNPITKMEPGVNI